MNSLASNNRRVALLIDTSMSWGVRIIKGIHQFAQEEGKWLFHVEPRGRYEAMSIPQGWTGEGIIARINRQELADEIAASGIPAVNVSWYDFSGPNVARCTVDERETGRMAAEYFLGAGFHHFGYCGPRHRPGYQDLLAEEYRDVLQVAGYSCESYRAQTESPNTIPWDEQLASLVAWLSLLPRPTAILCWSAAGGRQVTEACHYAGIRVPDDVAVLGGENDDLMNEISDPPLSTIDQPGERVGLEAARILSRMMRGEPKPEEPTLLSPTRVIVRHSSDILAVDNQVVRTALRLIHEQAREGVNVAGIISQMHIARRALEQRFIQHLGRTPAAEIRRVRIEVAKQLLVETELNMGEIARKCGFREQDLFSRTFRRALGMTPSHYRGVHRHAD
ncbi:XylR family transcriptional regulator [Pirellulales bacterium]|nr:XylR family transcriptional regulator [Pirellulales bacterium]